MKLGPNGRAIPVELAAREAELPDEAMDHYWHPDRPGVEQAPDWFQRDLRSIDKDDRVRVVRPPESAPLYQPRAWLVWYRKPAVTHYLSPGWLMLREWRDVRHEPLSLDVRVFSYLYSVSAQQFGSGKGYWNHCVSEMKREKDAKNKVHTDGNHDRMEDYRQFTQIKNIGSGSKFSAHHDGTVVPSRGHANWLAERRRRLIPGDVARDEAKQREARC